ncbi:acyl-CoA dehydrogenase [Tsukamurella sp. 8F]|uniref:acyl-CoA dehydrogenase n=1 Tax=unclassified Tsukamurella TaxID=2633480 RepID=UPI0023B8CC6C|nr:MULTISPECIES: acyl-CoA dehydrogenase [unclassified Tsukamurella]MDF0528373.1 acyl-CoA dehydrogenase [Tsukamurella sp. 8J]MDF0586198.1 acyl-CoA dehydrogenase [Tsukamurella sp. 8F]
MRFSLTAEQQAFARALDGILGGADVPAVNRHAADGKYEPVTALWGRLAEAGVAGLLVPEDLGGTGGTAIDLVLAFDRLGFHGVPGPWIETAAVGAILAEPELQAAIVDGSARITVAAPPWTPYALDPDVATSVYLASDRGFGRADAGERYASVDPTRTLASVSAAEERPRDPSMRARALDTAALACAATLIGAGERMLAMTVEYVIQRRQFGRAIGEFQAIKHALADVRVALDFAHPVLHGAARALAARDPLAARDVSAAKVVASSAAAASAAVALQSHGAIGYTREADLSIWYLRTRALLGAWGTAGQHRARVLGSLTGPLAGY